MSIRPSRPGRIATLHHALPCSVACALAAAAALAGVAGPARAAEAWLDGDIRALALAGDRLVALRDGDAWLLTTAGRVLGALAPARPSAPVTVTPRRRPSADDVVDLLGIADDDVDSDLVRDALDDEGARPARRRRDRRASLDDDHQRAGDAGDAPKALAASRDAIWMGAGGAVSRLDARGSEAILPVAATATATARRRAFAALAVTPDGRRLAAITDHDVLHSSDGGRSWSLLAGLPTRARAVALSPDGDDTFVLDEDGVAIVAHRERVAIFSGQAHDLAWCGGELLIAGADGLFAWRWDVGLEPRARRPPARRLACSPAIPDVALAFGPDLSISRDGGRTWHARGGLPAAEIQSVALAPRAIWIGAVNGLYRESLDTLLVADGQPVADTAGATPPPAIARDGADGSARAPEIHSLRSRAWYPLLPRISLVGTRSAIRPGGDHGAIWLLLTFPLQRGHPGAPRAARLAGDLLRRRADATAALVRAAAGAASDEESAALARLARDGVDEIGLAGLAP